MASTQQGFESRAERVADDERKIQDEVDAKEARSFEPKSKDETPPQTGARIIVTFWGGLLLAVALALASGAVRRRPAATWVFLGTVTVGIGMLLFAEMFLATEPVRFGCQESILCKLASIALVALSVDTIIERRQR